MSKGFGKKFKNISDTNLLLTITMVVFFAMYIGAILFLARACAPVVQTAETRNP